MLNELPESEVENLCSILKREWPRSIQAINFLLTSNEWRKKKPSLDYLILYNEKNIQSGIFISIHKSGCIIPGVTMYALDSYEDELEEMFSDFLDKCDETVKLCTISEKHIPIMKKVIYAKAYKILHSDNLVVFSMNIDKAKNLEISYLPEVEVKPLNKEHLKEIYDMWGKKSFHSFEELENCFELNNESALGIFNKETGRLLSRCIRLHDGSISALQTIEEARGKGYAKLLLKHVGKKLADLSIVPYLYADDFNEPSLKAILGAGYQIVTHSMNATIKKVKY